MTFVRSLVMSAACLVALPSWSCVKPWLQQQYFDVVGSASNQDGESVYLERLVHEPGPDGGRLNVAYTKPGGAPIANKVVKYRCQPTTPSFELTDSDGNPLESVEWGDAEVITQQEETNARLDTPTEPAIVDAGFDNAIKLHWDELLDGKNPEFQYLFSREGRFLKLRFAKIEEPPARYPADGEELVHFRITPANPFLRLFASPLYVGYRADSRDLRYYLGPSNLPSMRRQKDVLIVYDYAEG